MESAQWNLLNGIFSMESAQWNLLNRIQTALMAMIITMA